MGLLSAFADRIATKHCRAELERFTAALETMTDLEIAELMVFATRMRQVIERQGVDLLDPGGLHISHPELLPQVVEQHTRMKKTRKHSRSIGIASLESNSQGCRSARIVARG